MTCFPARSPTRSARPRQASLKRVPGSSDVGAELAALEDRDRTRTAVRTIPIWSTGRDDQRLYWGPYLFSLLLVLLPVGGWPGSVVPPRQCSSQILQSEQAVVSGDQSPRSVRSTPGRAAIEPRSKRSRRWIPPHRPEGLSVVRTDRATSSCCSIGALDWAGELDRLVEDVHQSLTRHGRSPLLRGPLPRCGTVWPLMDRSLRHQLARSCREPLIAASDYELERLLGVFTRSLAQADELRSEDLCGILITGILGTLQTTRSTTAPGTGSINAPVQDSWYGVRLRRFPLVLRRECQPVPRPLLQRDPGPGGR